MEAIDIISSSGYSRPIPCITMENKEELLTTIKCHYTLYLSKAVTDQFKAGMCVAGVVEAFYQYPHLLEGYFVVDKATPLTAG